MGLSFGIPLMANRRHLYLLNTLIGALVVQHSDCIVLRAKRKVLRGDLPSDSRRCFACSGNYCLALFEMGVYAGAHRKLNACEKLQILF